jgi:dihydroflavonol-4-reductase
MKVFVTGGNGFIGSRTVHELVRRGHDVRCLLRTTSNVDRIRGVPFETHYGDILDLESLRAGVAGCDAIIHLAGVSSWSQIREMGAALHSVAVEGTRNILQAGLDHQVSRVVCVSSSVAINASSAPIVFNENSNYELDGSGLHYSIAKHEAEKVIESFAKNQGMKVVTVNPCEVYGPEDDALVTAGNLMEVLKGGCTLVCSGGTAVAHVDDIARGIVAALDKGRPGERYILGGENLSIEGLARKVRRVAGKKGPIVRISNRILVPLCRLISRLGLPSPVPLDVLNYAVLYWFVDSTKAQRELGYAHRPTEETLEDVVRWLRKTGRLA